MDFERRFEQWEGDNLFGYSGFTIEDLPSNYLGFVIDYEGNNINSRSDVFERLGPMIRTDSFPPRSTNPKDLSIHGSPPWFGSGEALKNAEFLPMVNDGNGWTNVCWPRALQLPSAIDSSTGLWHFVRGETTSEYYSLERGPAGPLGGRP